MLGKGPAQSSLPAFYKKWHPHISNTQAILVFEQRLYGKPTSTIESAQIPVSPGHHWCNDLTFHAMLARSLGLSPGKSPCQPAEIWLEGRLLGGGFPPPPWGLATQVWNVSVYLPSGPPEVCPGLWKTMKIVMGLPMATKDDDGEEIEEQNTHLSS